MPPAPTSSVAPPITKSFGSADPIPGIGTTEDRVFPGQPPIGRQIQINNEKGVAGVEGITTEFRRTPKQEVSMSLLHPPGKAIEGLSWEATFSNSDRRRLADSISTARFASTATAAALLTPMGPGGEAHRLTEQTCVFDHCGLLLFPRTLAAGLHELDRLGLAPLPTTPSTVVRRRLITRYGLEPAGCDVAISRLRLDLPDGRRHPAVEVFLFPRDRPSYESRIEDAETAYGFEQHTAFVVTRPSSTVLARLITAWRTDAGLVWEGGGHNPHEGGPEGSTVLYFVRDRAHPTGSRRFELHCAGDFRAFLDGLDRDADTVDRAYREWQPTGPDSPA
jgi:hypothetical protein